jgi:hypothetical protein
MKNRSVTRYAIYMVWGGKDGRQETAALLDTDCTIRTYRSALQSDSKAVMLNNQRDKYGNNVVFISKPVKSFLTI